MIKLYYELDEMVNEKHKMQCYSNKKAWKTDVVQGVTVKHWCT
jgi:hypothetical protein